MKVDTTVKKIIEDLRVADAKTIGDVLYAKKEFKNLQSARVYSQKHLNILVESRELVRGEHWYATPSYRGEFKEHDRLLTQAVAQILKLKVESFIFREVSFEPGLRSDAAVLLKKADEGLCFILEIVHNEAAEYTNMKLNAWKNWKGATEALSKLFGYRIPFFSVVISRNEPDDQFSRLIREVKQ